MLIKVEWHERNIFVVVQKFPCMRCIVSGLNLDKKIESGRGLTSATNGSLTSVLNVGDCYMSMQFVSR